MTTKLKWRLANRPTPHEVLDLQTASLLTKEEAREILFTLETEEDREMQSLKDEIIFLRTLASQLSSSTQIAQTITVLPNEYKPWHVQPWYAPYAVWCSNVGTPTMTAVGNSIYSINTATTTGSATNGMSINYTPTPVHTEDFTDIKTF